MGGSALPKIFGCGRLDLEWRGDQELGFLWIHLRIPSILGWTLPISSDVKWWFSIAMFNNHRAKKGIEILNHQINGELGKRTVGWSWYHREDWGCNQHNWARAHVDTVESRIWRWFARMCKLVFGYVWLVFSEMTLFPLMTVNWWWRDALHRHTRYVQASFSAAHMTMCFSIFQFGKVTSVDPDVLDGWLNHYDRCPETWSCNPTMGP